MLESRWIFACLFDFSIIKRLKIVQAKPNLPLISHTNSLINQQYNVALQTIHQPRRATRVPET